MHLDNNVSPSPDPSNNHDPRDRKIWVWLFAGMSLCLCLCATMVGVGGYFITQATKLTSTEDRTLPANTTVVSTPATQATLPANHALVREPNAVTQNRITFIDLDGQVNTINPDGSERRTLTDGGTYQFPAWSPDGQYIAAIGGERDNIGVHLLEDREDAYLFAKTVYKRNGFAPIYLYWAPDSASLAILANHVDGLGLYLAQVANANDTRLVRTGQPFYWDWLPDSSQILIHTGSGSTDEQLTFMDPTDFDEDVGENLAPPGLFQAPGVSPSGNYWAFSEGGEVDGNWLVVQNQLGITETRLRHAGFLSLGWSPVAEQLAYTSPSEAIPALTGPLRLLDMNSQESRQLSRDRVISFFWSPDGQQIAYLTLAGGSQINAQLPAKLVTLGKPLRQDDLQSLELWVVDIATGDARFLTDFIPPPLFVFQFLPFSDQYALSHSLWSPDSQSLVLPMELDGAPHIVVVPASGEAWIPISEGTAAFWSHQ